MCSCRPELEAFQSRRKRINHRFAQPNACPLAAVSDADCSVAADLHQFAASLWSSRITGHACWRPPTWPAGKAASTVQCCCRCCCGCERPTARDVHRRQLLLSAASAATRVAPIVKPDACWLTSLRKWDDTWYLGAYCRQSICYRIARYHVSVTDNDILLYLSQWRFSVANNTK